MSDINTENYLFEEAFNRLLNAIIALSDLDRSDNYTNDASLKLEAVVNAATANYNAVFANPVFNASHNPVGCVMKGMRKAARGNAQDDFTMWNEGVKDARAMHASNVQAARKLTGAR